MSIPPPRSSRRATLKEDSIKRTLSTTMVPSSRVMQVQQSSLVRSSSSDRVVRDLLGSSPSSSSSVPKEEPFAFASFLDSSSSDGPVLSFTTGIDASHDVEEHEEEVEWAWSAPSSEPLPPVFEGGAETDAEVATDMLVDLNSAFSAAFGDKFEAPVPKRKGHSRGLSGVFVTPQSSAVVATAPSEVPATATATAKNPFLSLPPQSTSSATPEGSATTNSSRRRDSVSPRNLLAHKAAAAEKDGTTGLAHREKVVRELLDSEQVYVDNLNKLIEIFYRPLTGRDEKSGGKGSSLKEAPLLNKSDADLLFGQVEVIALYNQRLLLDLKDRLNSPDYASDQTPISDIFIKMKSFLQVYVYYSENYPRAMKVYEAVMSRNSKTKRALKAAEKEAGNVLEAFLILPIQRIPRYILLLMEIIRFTPPTHPDLQQLTETVGAIKELCSAINEAPKKLQEANEMLSIYKRLVPSLPDLLVASRHLVCQTRAWVINADGAVKSRVLFVFNDLLLVTRPEGDRFFLRFRIALPNVEVYDSPPQNVAGKQALIVTLKAKQGLQIVLAFKEEEEKKQLMSDIAKHNPAITFGAPGFVPLAERPHLGPEEKKESGSMKLQRQSSDRSALSHSAQTVLAGEESGSRLSGLLSRKKTLTSTPIGSRKSVKSPVPPEFEIVRTDVASSPPGQGSGFSSNSGSGSVIRAQPPSADVLMSKEIALKLEEQQNLQKLLQFYRKCNDQEGINEATASIARIESELAELKQKVRMSAEKPAVAEETNKKRQHARKRSMSTSALPKMISATNAAASTSVAIPSAKDVASPAAVRRPEPAAVVAPKKPEGSRVLYDFTGVNEGELTCKAGDSIVAKSENGDWVLCVLTESGKQGWLPKSYCHIVKEVKAKTPFDDE